MTAGIYPRPLGPATDRMLDVLLVVATLTASNHGRAPTLREIGVAVGIASLNGVAAHLRALERRGLLTSEPMISRSLRLTTAGRIALGMPVKRCPTCGGEALP